LVDIVQALEGGPIALTECISEPGECQHEDSCPVQVNWLNINNLIRNALKEISLLDMIRPMTGLVQLGGGSEEPRILR
jgi:DNA-binding IscR family transcriptional regulator